MQPVSQIHVFNTLGRSLQAFEPQHPEKVGMYVCGPTVQSDPHLGHGRFAVAFDVIVRYLRWRGFDVTYVRNITDVEDKIIAAAAETGETTEELAARVAARFAEAFEALGVLAPDHEPRATEHIDGMIRIIERLIERGLAYPEENGDVYYSVRTLESYGKLSGRKPDELRAGARVEVDEFKHDPLDFALWKAAKPGEPSWDSPWGPGRPGWHIECSAMSSEFLGDTFDIHGGGNDLIFPHHENEIAQSEGATGKPFARYWLHSGMVNLSGEKMSKSTGHIIGLHEAIAQYGGTAVRLFYLRAHYRSPLEFSEELVADAKASLDRIGRVLGRTEPGGAPDVGVIARFVEKMDADFAT
ncbi:MAG: cysteine--tRNA ligase, partial [Acidimicrobiia bacterium]